MKHAANLSLFTVAALPNSAAGGHLAPPDRFVPRKTIPWQADNASRVTAKSALFGVRYGPTRAEEMIQELVKTKSKREKPKPLADQGDFIPIWTNKSGTVKRLPDMSDSALYGALQTLRGLGPGEVYNGLPAQQWRGIIAAERAKRIQK